VILGAAILFWLTVSTPSVSELCQATGVENSLQAHLVQGFSTLEVAKTSFESQTSDEIFRDFVRHSGSFAQFDWQTDFLLPWVMFNHPRKEVNEATYLIQDQILRAYSSRNFPNNAEAWAAQDWNAYLRKQIALQESPYSKFTQQRLSLGFDWLISPDSFKNDLSQVEFAAPYLCKFYLGSKECIEAVSKVLGWMNPRLYYWFDYDSKQLIYSSVSIEDELFLFMKEPFLRKVMAKVALRVRGLVTQATGGKLPREHWFEIVHDEFRQHFLRKTLKREEVLRQADDWAWRTAGLLATRGVSWTSLLGLGDEESVSVIISFTLMASAMQYLDFLTLETGHPFSYPKQLKTSCHLGRPYHFWMSAYLARRLLADGHKVKDSFLASFLMGMLYELGSTTYGRRPLYPFQSEFMDPYNNGIRANLAFKALGAQWGVGNGSSSLKPHILPPASMPVDGFIRFLLNHGSPLNEEQKQIALKENSFRLLHWHRLFVPYLLVPKAYWNESVIGRILNAKIITQPNKK